MINGDGFIKLKEVNKPNLIGVDLCLLRRQLEFLVEFHNWTLILYITKKQNENKIKIQIQIK